METPDGSTFEYNDADVKIGYGSQFTTLPSSGNGSYSIYTGGPSASNFSLAPGQQYEIQIDFDKNGTIDATGTVRMVGIPTITYPEDGSTVPNHFTATWDDNGTSFAGYSADYWVSLASTDTNGVYRIFETTNQSVIIGNGSVDSSFYDYYQTNDPLPSGSYSMDVWSFNGPAGFLSSVGDQLPNINGQNVTGYFYSNYLGNGISFNCSGLLSKVASAYAASGPRPQIPPVLKRYFNSIPSMVKRKAGISLPKL